MLEVVVPVLHQGFQTFSDVDLIVDMIFLAQVINDAIVYFSFITYASIVIVNIWLATANPWFIPMTWLNDVLGWFYTPFIYLVYMPASMSTTGVFQSFSNVMRFILINFVDQNTFDRNNAFLQVMFYWIPTVFTYMQEFLELAFAGFVIYNNISSA